MEFFAREWAESGIWLTQVGYPLADRGKCCHNAARSDRFLTGLDSGGSVPAVADPVNEKVAQTGFVIVDVVEVGRAAMPLAELSPAGEGAVFGVPGFGNVGLAGVLESNADVSCERIADGGRASRHGLSCG